MMTAEESRAYWNKIMPPSKSVLRARAVRSRYGFPMDTCLFVCALACYRAQGRDESKAATPTPKQNEAISWLANEIKEGR